jgi:hypothetical protein
MEGHLAEGIATLSSFDRYKQELLSGQLSWAPMHESGGWVGRGSPGRCLETAVASLDRHTCSVN